MRDIREALRTQPINIGYARIYLIYPSLVSGPKIAVGRSLI